MPKDTSAVIEKIFIKTDDSIKIALNYYYRIDKRNISQPLVILIHQYKSNKEQWAPEFIDSLILCNFKIIAYDIRWHGESGKSDSDIQELLSTNMPIYDLKSVMEWISDKEGIDKERIAVIGTSMGASLAIYSKYFLNSKVVIGISGGRGTFEAYTGFDERMMSMKPIPRIENVMLICGSSDNNYAEEEKYIMNNFLKPPSDMITYPSAAHGKYLINEYPEIYSVIIKWIIKYI